jgi:hypothetical protein
MQRSRPLDNQKSRVTRSSHHVCFGCYKAFKKPASTQNDWVLLEGYVYPCPNCKKPMAQLGKNFRTPRSENIRAWRLLERLFMAGFRFDSSLEGRVPNHPSDLEVFLQARARPGKAEQLLATFSRKP